MGLYSDGSWWLDLNENLVWDGVGAGQDAHHCCFGLSDDLPVSGDWTSTGFDKIGVRHASMMWVLDNGNFVWDSYQREQIYGPFGLVGDSVVRWNKSKVKAN